MKLKSDDPLAYEHKRHEQDRLGLLHDIVFKASLDKWDDVNKLSELYVSIYGPLPGNVTYTEITPIDPRDI